MSINQTNYDPDAFKDFFQTHQTSASVPDDVGNSGDPDNSGAAPGSTGNNEPNNTDPAPTNTDPQGTPTNSEPSGDGDGGDNSTGDNGGDNNVTDRQKQNRAFAQMRMQSNRQQAVLRQIADTLGVQNTDNPDDVLNALQTLATKAQAQKQGIPEEVLNRLQTLEAERAENRRRNNLIAAGQGFQQLKNQHKLTDEALQSFADELIADGINPYENPVNLIQEYRNRHFDELIEAAIQRGVQQEIARATKAGTQSSTPSKVQGGTSTPPDERINSVADLTRFLNENNK